MLKQKFTLWAATIALALFALPSLAQADTILNVDLTVENTMTITALEGLSAETLSASDTLGIYLEDFYGGAVGSVAGNASGGGDLTAFLSDSDGGALLFVGAGDTGLNVWAMSTGTLEFETGIQAMTGSQTWTLDAAAYDLMLAGATGGDVWSPADSVDELPPTGSAVVIGQYVVKRPGGVIPEPSSIALLGLGCVGFAFRRRR